MVHRILLGLTKVSVLGAVVAPEQMKAALSRIKLTSDLATIPLPRSRSKSFSPDTPAYEDEDEF